ncbi:hypothetical protein ABIE78_005202 [Sinorhizobium fredii]|uniref:Uncharacterized protein n=1 Tax=Sinorhizobium fredii (strain USDA 257) TaxID=1185652 RepID=I3WZH8_SINF2|nr:hypothetical protein [Sinorhizobium fredii]AFL49034.1 hypothetical protein USDA257_c04370 [Sinorhizobium fredii USDA 257]
MSRISDLVTRMAVIPDKERRAIQLGEMIAVRDKLRISADRAEELRSLSSALEPVGGTDFVERAKQGLAQASSSALRLKARLESGSGFDRKRSDEALTAINERLENATAAINKGWRTLVDGHGTRFRPLAVAAERASLPGADKLNAAIVRLEEWRDCPPTTPQEATAYVANAARIPASIAELGLEGRAGKFMVDAANGRARARDLQEAEVIAFLDAHPAVWSLLKVGF